MENQGVNFGGIGAGAGLITKSTPVPTGQFGPLKDKYVSPGFERKGATEAQLTADYGKMAEPLRKALAQQLKSAGFKVPVTGKYSIKVRDAFLSASQALSEEISTLARQDPARLQTTKYDLTSFLKSLATTEQVGSGADNTPTTVQSITEYRPETLRDLVNKVSFALTGEAADEEFINSQISSIQKELKKPQNIQQTTYTPKVGGVQKQITQEGFSPERYLIEEISKGDAAKASSIMGFYEVFNKAIGRDNG
jgi:membrane protease subunit (stomatin/prohibitin family)